MTASDKAQGRQHCAEPYTIPVKVAEHGRGLPLPARMTSEAAGFDLIAAVTEPVVIEPGKTALIPTGLHLAIPPGLEGQVRPRSGLAFTHGVTVLNSPGTIDADYRGEVKVILINLGENPFIVNRGERIAQLVFHHITPVFLREVEELDQTDRGAGGFGHTGRK